MNTFPKIALVKQTDCIALYTRTTGSIKGILESSRTHIGPISLIKELKADIIIIKTPKKLQNTIWKESVRLGDKPRQKIKRFQNQDPSGETNNDFQDYDDVEWDKYDIVIAIDACVPYRIVKKHRNIMWAGLILVPGVTWFLFNRFHPFFGYNISLNDTLSDEVDMRNKIAGLQKSGKTIINFPLAFMTSNIVRNLYRQKKSGIHLEPNTAQKIIKKDIKKLENFGPLSYLVPKKDYLREITGRKYFIALPYEVRVLRGNALVEANAAGCLILFAKSINISYKPLLNDFNLYTDIDDLSKKLNEYEKNDKLFRQHLSMQQKNINTLAFENPREELLSIYSFFKEVKLTVLARLKKWMIDKTFAGIYYAHYLFALPAYRATRFVIKLLFGIKIEDKISKFFN